MTSTRRWDVAEHLRLVSGRRARELPSTWEAAEGRAVLWSDWAPPLRIFVCPPPPPEVQVCSGCGEAADYETSSGRIVPRADETIPVTVVTAGRPRVVRRRQRPYVRLFAFQCIGCGHVEIYDEHTGELS